MGLGELYCKQLREQFTGYHANFPPNQPLAAGDYGFVKDEVFRRVGNIAELGITFSKTEGVATSNFQFKSTGAVGIDFIAKGDIAPSGVPMAKAGIELHFSSENAVFFNATGCMITGIADLKKVGDQILSKVSARQWDTDFYVITALVNSANTMVVASASKDAEVKLEASSDAIQEIDLASASLSLRIKRTRNTSLEIVTSNPQTPLMQMSRVRGLFHKDFVPEAASAEGVSPFTLLPDEELPLMATPEVAAEAAAAPVFTLEATPSPFEIDRAISAYVPLLQASYALAKQEPFNLPPGYSLIGQVRVSPEAEAAEAEALTDEQRRAIEHDERALLPVRPDAAGPVPEAIADPSAFGFVVREDATGAVLITIRGTQTPQEWLADFTPIPFPFGDVPGFGLVHIGFSHFYHKIRNSVQSALAPLDPGTRVTIVGHSLGGAMAVLCAVDVERNMGKKNVDVCTFGGPRTGKIDFRVHFNREIPRCFRVVNQLDIVPHVPSVITGWNHVGEGIEVKGNGPSAHSMEAYLDGLKKLRGPAGGAEAAPVIMSARVP